ncbi:hypothetical protein [Roseimaritima sediminicola]|uniref:hypothetical protein n=1 Tax=Roseimaritima sediminicola TaxID=2662066 RepID=UPI0012982B65|nr:hypothetical protein [Roseimaritima sediminicola]
MPRISILSLIGLTTLVAVLSWVVRTGFSGNYVGLKALVVAVTAAVVCFVTYAAVFSISYLFSLAMHPLVQAAGGDLSRPQAAVPTRCAATTEAVAESLNSPAGGSAVHCSDADGACVSTAPAKTLPAADAREDAS